MLKIDEALATHLKAHRQSLTKPRLAVFSALQGHDPRSMHELVADCRGIDRASVYRTVALFERLGIIQRVQLGWKYKLELTDAFSRHHHHLTCLRCGRVVSFDESAVFEKELQRVARSNNFSIQSHQLEIQGLCPACQNAEHAKIAALHH